jgi:hypothetical protein
MGEWLLSRDEPFADRSTPYQVSAYRIQILMGGGKSIVR